MYRSVNAAVLSRARRSQVIRSAARVARRRHQVPAGLVRREPVRLADRIARVFRRWERLRPLYNGLLAVFVALGPAFRHADAPEQVFALVVCLFGAVLANLCYMAGPIAEAYLVWLGIESRIVTATLFVVGVAISLPLTILFVAGITEF